MATPLIVAGTRSRLAPPAELTEVERAIFIDLVGAEPADRFRASDLPLLTSYVRSIALENEAAAHLRAEGHVINGEKSPWLAILAQAQKGMVAFSLRLRLSPQGRSPTSPKRPEPVLSYYERVALERRGETS